MTQTWLGFLACAAVICVSGVRLARYGDAIATLSGMSRSWIGIVLLATVTSLPELVTGLSAVSIADVPDIAVGDALGSCIFNVVILSIADFLLRGDPIYTRVSAGHLLSAAFGVILIGAVGFGLLVAGSGLLPAIGHVGLTTPILIVLYVISMRALFQHERVGIGDFVESSDSPVQGLTLRQAIGRYLLWSVGVVAAGVALPFVGDRLGQVMGWEASFVGSLFVAAATSIPEVVVTLAAMRMGAHDLAVANLFGSNLFNMLILALDDLAYTKGPLLQNVSPLNAVTSVTAVIMTGLAMVALIYRPRGRVFGAISWVSLGLFALYVLNAYVLFFTARP